MFAKSPFALTVLLFAAGATLTPAIAGPRSGVRSGGASSASAGEAWNVVVSSVIEHSLVR